VLFSPAAASQGFSFADPYAIGLLVGGLAVFTAIGALSHQHDRAFSASLIYLVIGLGAAVLVEALGVGWLSPIDDSAVFERTSELAVIIALFATGLKLERELRPGAWAPVWRLLAIAMPLTIAAVALFGWAAMGLSAGAAIVLGAALAPTDPVLAGDIGVGPPGDEEERDPNFSVTGEAGLNDGLAFPFVFLGVFVAEEDGAGWVVEWLVADVVYAIAVAVVLGAAIGYAIAALAVTLRDRELLDQRLDGWLGIAAVLVIYGATEVVGAYGFVAAFAGGIAFRRYEHGHEYNRRVHDGAETVEKFGELALVLLVASAVNLTGLAEPGVAGWLLVPLLIGVIRPLSVAVALAGARLDAGERAFIAWFGVRGIGSLYYASVAVGLGVFSVQEARTIFWTVVACVIVSIVVHGITATPLSRRWLEGHRQVERT
jgi:NhaP-type Na+/H+ or K+/H+ antiporter